MKTLIGVGLAAAFFAAAQNAPTRQTLQLAGGPITVSAGRTQVKGNGTVFSNGVIITVNGVHVSADRAVLEVNDISGRRPADVQLEGNVRLSLPKAQ